MASYKNSRVIALLVLPSSLSSHPCRGKAQSSKAGQRGRTSTLFLYGATAKRWRTARHAALVWPRAHYSVHIRLLSHVLLLLTTTSTSPLSCFVMPPSPFTLHHHYRIISIWPNAIVLLSACCLRSNYFWFSHHCCLLGFALRYQLEHIWLVFIRWGNLGWIISKFGENLHCKI